VFKQVLIPGFPEGAQRIGEALSILEKGGRVTYFVGGDNYFSHPLDDKPTDRHFKCTSGSISGPGATVNCNFVLIAPQQAPESRRQHCLAAAVGRFGGRQHELPHDERWIVMLSTYHARRWSNC